MVVFQETGRMEDNIVYVIINWNIVLHPFTSFIKTTIKEDSMINHYCLKVTGTQDGNSRLIVSLFLFNRNFHRVPGTLRLSLNLVFILALVLFSLLIMKRSQARV